MNLHGDILMMIYDIRQTKLSLLLILVDIDVIKPTKENLFAAETNFSIKVMSLQTCSMIYYPFTIRNSNNFELKVFEGKYF